MKRLFLRLEIASSFWEVAKYNISMHNETGTIFSKGKTTTKSVPKSSITIIVKLNYLPIPELYPLRTILNCILLWLLFS